MLADKLQYRNAKLGLRYFRNSVFYNTGTVKFQAFKKYLRKKLNSQLLKCKSLLDEHVAKSMAHLTRTLSLMSKSI